MNLFGNWSYPTTIKFGAGRIAELPESCSQAGIKNPLMVTDKVLANLPITMNALDILEEASLGRKVFSDVDANPNTKNLEAGIRAYREGNHDGIIVFGGGSAIDLGKIVALMVGQTRPVWDFEDIGDYWKRANAQAIAPIIAIPTTAGTGSEVGRAGVLVDSVSKEKKIIFHPNLLPSVVICDPELTVGMPQFITAGTGLDAFAHCVEAFSSLNYHPMSQGIALEGMRLVKEYLPRAYADGNDLEARSNMMSAAAMGSTAFQKGLGAIHALSHPIGALHNTHHGTTNAVCMPPVLQFNSKVIAERFDGVAEYLGIVGGFRGFCDFVDRFNDDFKIPRKLSLIGVVNPDVDALVKGALADPSAAGNPVAMTEENTRNLLEQIL